MAKTDDRIEVNGQVYFSADYFLKILDRAVENVKRAMTPKPKPESNGPGEQKTNTAG